MFEKAENCQKERDWRWKEARASDQAALMLNSQVSRKHANSGSEIDFGQVTDLQGPLWNRFDNTGPVCIIVALQGFT